MFVHLFFLLHRNCNTSLLLVTPSSNMSDMNQISDSKSEHTISFNIILSWVHIYHIYRQVVKYNIKSANTCRRFVAIVCFCNIRQFMKLFIIDLGESTNYCARTKTCLQLSTVLQFIQSLISEHYALNSLEMKD